MSSLFLPSASNAPGGYEYVELNVDSATAFNTAVQGRLSTDTPQFYIGNGFTGIAGIKIIEAVIPVSWYTINEDIIENATGLGENVIFFGFNSNIAPSGIIQTGNYSLSQLAASLTTTLNTGYWGVVCSALGLSESFTAPDNSVVYDPITSTFTWTLYYDGGTGNFFMNPYGGGDNAYGRLAINSILGFNNGGNNFTVSNYSGPTMKATFTSKFASAAPYNYINIESKILGPLLKCVPNQDTSSGINAFSYDSTGMTTPHLANVPISVNAGQVNVWQDCGQAQVYETPFLSGIQRFDLYLTLGPNKIPIYLNGQSFQVKFKMLLEVAVSPLTASNSGIV